MIGRELNLNIKRHSSAGHTHSKYVFFYAETCEFHANWLPFDNKPILSILWIYFPIFSVLEQNSPNEIFHFDIKMQNIKYKIRATFLSKKQQQQLMQ